MSSILTLTPGTFQQSSFDKVGDGLRYEEIELNTTGTQTIFTAKTPLKLNPGTSIIGDEKAIIKLIANAPVNIWKSQTPVFSLIGNNYLLEGFTFDGNAGNQLVTWGDGYHNLIGGEDASNITVRKLTIKNTLGDGGRFVDCKNIDWYNNEIYGVGHDGFYVDRCTDVEAYSNTIYTRINSALRSKGSKNVLFHGNKIYSNNTYTPRTGPGIQVENSRVEETTSDVQIYDNWIEGCQGPGIWAAGHTAKAVDAASGLIIRNNVIKACGQMPVLAEKTQAARLSAVGAICLDGWTDVEIYDNTLDGNYNGIRVGPYITTSAGSGYKVNIGNNIITNTKAANNKDAYAGYALAVTVTGKYKVTCSGNGLFGNLKGVYGVVNEKGYAVDPLYADAEYHLQASSPYMFTGSQLGRWNNTQVVEPETPDPVEEVESVDLFVSCAKSEADIIAAAYKEKYQVYRSN